MRYKDDLRQWWDWGFRDWFAYFRGFGASKYDAIYLALEEMKSQNH